ncbi:hypothetical protein L7F22_053034 [Adiantum nelumboides]|nr:hypothetical protein [Adiantum nelumboides]
MWQTGAAVLVLRLESSGATTFSVIAFHIDSTMFLLSLSTMLLLLRKKSSTPFGDGFLEDLQRNGRFVEGPSPRNIRNFVKIASVKSEVHHRCLQTENNNVYVKSSNLSSVRNPGFCCLKGLKNSIPNLWKFVMSPASGKGSRGRVKMDSECCLVCCF